MHRIGEDVDALRRLGTGRAVDHEDDVPLALATLVEPGGPSPLVTRQVERAVTGALDLQARRSGLSIWLQRQPAEEVEPEAVAHLDLAAARSGC